jgi:taurine dioxygenase
VSGVAGWKNLPESLQQEVADLTSRHFYETRMPGFDWPRFITDWPIRNPRPRTGEPILFVTEHHSVRIPELDEAKSREVLDALFACLYAPERRYEHVWQLNDLLVWDNLAHQHARTRYSDPGQGKRALQRVALSEVGFHDLIEQERARQLAA